MNLIVAKYTSTNMIISFSSEEASNSHRGTHSSAPHHTAITFLMKFGYLYRMWFTLKAVKVNINWANPLPFDDSTDTSTSCRYVSKDRPCPHLRRNYHRNHHHCFFLSVPPPPKEVRCTPCMASSRLSKPLKSDLTAVHKTIRVKSIQRIHGK